MSGDGTYNRAYTYDLHGNILSLTTPSGTVTATYSGNQRSGNYTYDASGNMTADPDAGLTGMTYNNLNLLSGYTPAVGNSQFSLSYSASGEKLMEEEKESGIMENWKTYFGNLVYDNSLLYPTRLLIDGGYVDITTNATGSSSTYTYRYYVQDHLGNNRLVTDDSGTILQTNHYDPYGQLLSDISSTTAVSQYKYGNKEWDATTASYDFGARRYTPSIPRWTTIDPLAEKYYAISPYVYCAGNPVNLVDLEGLDFYRNTNGDIRWEAREDESFTVDNEEWQNIGSSFIFCEGNQLLLLKQRLDENNNYYIDTHSYHYNPDGNNESLFNDLEHIVGKGGLLAGICGNVFFNEMSDTWLGANGKLYDFSFNGNQYTGGRLQFAGRIGKGFTKLGNLFSFFNMAISANNAITTNNIDIQLSSIQDALMTGMGLFQGGLAISIFWSIGGKKAAELYTNNVIVPYIKMSMDNGGPMYLHAFQNVK